MKQHEQIPKIEAFWQWFRQMETEIANYFGPESTANEQDLIEQINNRVLDFGLFAWEIGPHEDRGFYLTISPNGDQERLTLSQLLVSKAPPLRNWVFFPAKPPKKWDFLLTVYDDFMMERTVEVFRWNYVLLEYPDDSLEVILEANNMSFLDKEGRQAAGESVLNNIIGEEAKIQFVDKMRIVESLDDEYAAISAPLRELREHFDEIMAEWADEV